MELLERVLPILERWLPTTVTLALVGGFLAVAHVALIRRAGRDQSSLVGRQIVMLVLTAVGVIALVLSLPLDTGQKGQLLSLLGLLLSAAIALASTTFLGNAIAGLMIRAVGDFSPGDFIRVGEHFGRVSERGLLHVEVQSEARDLVTIPNLHIVSNPVTVVRASGTVIDADVSLGYDVDHTRVERLLLAAAEAAGLSDPFVRVLALRDHAVCYRVSGFLKDVMGLITARSKLHASVLDALHGDGVEIVSPTFMNQRVLEPDQRFLAQPSDREAADARAETKLESIVFDKAERAGLREQLRQKHERMIELRARLAEEVRTHADDAEREGLAAKLERLERQIERVGLALEEEEPAED